MIKAVGLSTQIYERLRRRITEGRVREGEPLVISGLVREFKISHTPVREALSRLHAEGLVSFTANVGFRVADAPRIVDYQHWMQARLIIEVSAARFAVEQATDRDVAQLTEINDQIRSAVLATNFASVRRFSDLNAALHRKLMAMSGNPFLLKAHDQIWLGAQFSRTHYREGVIDRDKIAEEHQRIIEALARRDADATCEALRAHIIDSLARDQRRRGVDGDGKEL